MEKIVLTGATSMLGTALIKSALRNGDEVYAIIRTNTSRKKRIIESERVHYIYHDLSTLNNTDGLPTDCDVFYHFAWVGTDKNERDDPRIQEENIKFTLDAVDLAERIGCKKFVGAGSQAEYGPVWGEIDELTTCNPVTSYGVAKYTAGKLSRTLCERKGMTHVWGRILSLYGPNDNEGTMINYTINCWERGEPAKLSACSHSWNYLYESDAGNMFYKMGKESIPGGVFLVANPVSRPLIDYVRIMMKVYGNTGKVGNIR